MLVTERVLDPLKQTLLPSLLGADRIVFVGDRQTIGVLRTFYAGAAAAAGYRFVEFPDAPGINWNSVLDGRCVVVASVRDEASLTKRVKHLASEHDIATPIFRLFASRISSRLRLASLIPLKSRTSPPPWP